MQSTLQSELEFDDDCTSQEEHHNYVFIIFSNQADNFNNFQEEVPP